jgi:hypothetical protein
MWAPHAELTFPRLRHPWPRKAETQMHADKKGCTQRQSEPTSADVQPDGRASAPSACILLIGVHLRFHFLSRDHGRNRRSGTVVILGRSASVRAQGRDQGLWT